jgi:PAS domain S-box-containing protein
MSSAQPAGPREATSAVIAEGGNVREHASLLRLVANSVPALMAFYDATTMRCLFANASYARTFGFDEQTILGKTLAEVIGEETNRAIEASVNEVRVNHRAVRYERQLNSPDGPRWIEVQLMPHFAADGTLSGAFVLINDITRHREAEQALRESEERLSKFMDASAEGIVFHKDGIVTDANLPAQQMVGCTLAEMIGRKTLEFIAPDQVPKVLEVMAARA